MQLNTPIDDELHRRVNSMRALKGQSIREYVEEALRRQVEHDEAERQREEDERRRRRGR